MTIGKRIAEVRGERSRRLFAQHVGIVENTLRNYEQGLSLPNSDVIAEICAKENVSPTWLLYGRGSMHRGEEEDVDKDARIRELERQLAETKEEMLRAYRLATQHMIVESPMVQEPPGLQSPQAQTQPLEHKGGKRK